MVCFRTTFFLGLPIGGSSPVKQGAVYVIYKKDKREITTNNALIFSG